MKHHSSPETSHQRVTPRPSVEFNGAEPLVPLVTTLFGQQALPPQMLAMHTLITGMTGSGKTQSALLPLATSMLQYQLPDCAPTGGLVIDPKGELLGKLQKVPGIGGRIHVLGRNEIRLNIFEFDADLTVFERINVLKRTVKNQSVTGDSAHWVSMGWDFVSKLFEVHDEVDRNGMDFFGCVYALLKTRVSMGDFEMVEYIETRNMSDRTGLALTAQGQQAILDGMGSMRKFTLFLEELNTSHETLKKVSRVLTQLIQRHGLQCTNVLASYALDNDLQRQITYFAQSVGPMLSQLSDPSLETLVELDPLKSQKNQSTRSLASILDAGGIVLYTPGILADNADALVASTLRMLFQRYVSQRKNLLQPLVYVCDEFHRYVNCDENYGDDVFLSFCRSYRVMACLCTQSIAALQTVIAHQKSTGMADYATRALLNNCGNRLWFRSIDPQTQTEVRAIYPFQESHCRPHILDVRPLSKLETGGAYYLTAKGNQGRDQIALPAPTGQRLQKVVKHQSRARLSACMP